MAELVVDGADLVLRLSTAEKVGGLHGDLRAPRSSFIRVEVLDNAHKAAGFSAGLKVGTRLPGVIEVGRLYGDKKRFAAVHHDTPRGLRLVFDGQDFAEWIVGVADPEAVARSLEQG
ncbi:hypothetical protein GCM10029964_113710 [Kibdelosporangium lantanae]